MEDYLAKAREAIPTAQGVSVEERFSRSVEYVRPDGSKISVPSRDSSDITVRQGNSSWETNSRPVQTDSGLFGNATPQERAAAMQMANRDGRYSPVGNAPWARRAMLQDAIQNGDFTEAGHGDGGVFSEA